MLASVQRDSTCQGDHFTDLLTPAATRTTFNLPRLRWGQRS